jgi:CelD/BcsL family acetyltransferase involved in cellulose biosynthesis
MSMSQGPAAAFSPGNHLIMFILKQCCEQGVETFDFSIGDEPYKDHWCEIHTPMVSEAYAFTGLGRLDLLRHRTEHALKRGLARNPLLFRWGKRAEQHLKSLLRRS